ncbi:MAG: hypothetical protein CMO01_09780 [Thalassobius sp.]|nr:hypothetical protein [Thalassovita sp.]
MIKVLLLISISFFFLLDGFILLTWGKFIINVFEDGGEMADSIFLFFLIAATIYYGIITSLTWKLFRKNTFNGSKIWLQLALIFISGICSSVFILLSIYR